jgi:universal stress protein E
MPPARAPGNLLRIADPSGTLLMANSIRRILVAIRDLHHPSRAELRKAAQFARAANASVELFHAVDIPIRTNRAAAAVAGMTTKLVLAKLRSAERRLRQISRLSCFRGIEMTYHSSADYPPPAAVVRRAERIGADLVIAAAHKHGFAHRVFLKNTDKELIRQCPCPLLLVKSIRSYSGSVVLAAVDPFHAHAKPADLDVLLLQMGNTLAHLFKGSLHVVHAYAPLLGMVPLPTAMAIPAIAPPDAEQAHAELIANELSSLATGAGVPPQACHLRMGVIASELCAVARDTHASLVVMGAVSRSALRRIFLGSTAETVLDDLKCDVLVLKPRGFRSAVGTRTSTGGSRQAA